MEGENSDGLQASLQEKGNFLESVVRGEILERKSVEGPCNGDKKGVVVRECV